MTPPTGSSLPISRRGALATAASLLGYPWPWSTARATLPARFEREAIASVLLEQGLRAPLTLGMARVVLRPGASAWAAISGGVRIVSVESGLIGIVVAEAADEPISSADFAVNLTPPEPTSELLVPAGTTMVFARRGIASVRNPGTRSAVLLDVAIMREEPRSLARAFTTTSGVSFQLLASSSAGTAPLGALLVTLERLRLPAKAPLPSELSTGLTLIYLEAGAVDLVANRAGVAAARAAASAPYAVPGALRTLPVGEKRNVTAGGVIFLAEEASAELRNAGQRTVAALVLAVREAS